MMLNRICLNLSIYILTYIAPLQVNYSEALLAQAEALDLTHCPILKSCHEY